MASSEGLQTWHQPHKPQYRQRIRTQILGWFVIKPEYSWTFISYQLTSTYHVHLCLQRCMGDKSVLWNTMVLVKQPRSQPAHQPTNQASHQETSHNKPTNQQTNNRRNPTTNQSPSTRSHPTNTPVSWGNKQGHLSTTLDTAPGSWPQLAGCVDSESLVIPHMLRCLPTTTELYHFLIILLSWFTKQVSSLVG